MGEDDINVDTIDEWAPILEQKERKQQPNWSVGPFAQEPLYNLNARRGGTWTIGDDQSEQSENDNDNNESKRNSNNGDSKRNSNDPDNGSNMDINNYDKNNNDDNNKNEDYNNNNNNNNNNNHRNSIISHPFLERELTRCPHRRLPS